MTKHEIAWLLILRDYRKIYPSSEIAKMSAEAFEDTAISWARALIGIPTDRMRDVYQATICDSKFPPAAPEFLSTWKVIAADERPAQEERERRERDNTLRKSLPQGKAGPGQRAHELFIQRGGEAIVCNCPPKDCYQWPARLNFDCSAWECQQDPSCGFYCLVEHTLGAPKPLKPGTLRDSVKQQAPRPAKLPDNPVFQAARDAGFDPDAMTPAQHVDFQLFHRWWAAKFNNGHGVAARMTPDEVARQYPIYALENGTLAVDAFTEAEADELFESNDWMQWSDEDICAAQMFCEFRCVPQDIFESALSHIFKRTMNAEMKDVQAEYLARFPVPDMARIRKLVKS